MLLAAASGSVFAQKKEVIDVYWGNWETSSGCPQITVRQSKLFKVVSGVKQLELQVQNLGSNALEISLSTNNLNNWQRQRFEPNETRVINFNNPKSTNTWSCKDAIEIGGKISVWLMGQDQNYQSYKNYDLPLGWRCVNISDLKILLKNVSDNRIQIWSLDQSGNVTQRSLPLTFGQPGWSAVNYANGKVLWRHSDGRATLWNINFANGTGGSKAPPIGEYAAKAGWSVVNYADGKMLWQHKSGKISLSTIDNMNAQKFPKEHNSPSGCVPVNFADNKILWKAVSSGGGLTGGGETGKISLWLMDADGNRIDWKEHGPHAGWQPINYDGHNLLWKHTDERISYWEVTPEGKYADHLEHGPIEGWRVVNCSSALLGSEQQILWEFIYPPVPPK